jgi:hypothetical protein
MASRMMGWAARSVGRRSWVLEGLGLFVMTADGRRRWVAG